MKKLALVAITLFVVAIGAYGWNAHQNKQKFDAVMADYQKTAPAQR